MGHADRLVFSLSALIMARCVRKKSGCIEGAIALLCRPTSKHNGSSSAMKISFSKPTALTLFARQQPLCRQL